MTTETAQFHIKHEAFEGPVEVLLELIEKRKFFVNDISLAAVTDDFIAYIQNKGMHPEHVSAFLSVAATLLLIKARSLLPSIELTDEESESISDLQRRLALYQIISEASKWLISKYGKKIAFEGVPRNSAVVFAPDPSLGVEMLAGLVDGALVRVPPPAPKKPEARVFKTISIAEVLDTLHERIQKALSVNFNDIIVHSPDGDEKQKKVYVIVSFLGMLELVRRGFVDAVQEDGFQSITLSAQTVTAQNEE
ncbi:MAG: ScpA family protein [Patescibacteria group bacterium]